MALGNQAALQLQPVQARHLHVQNQASRFIEPARGEKVFGGGEGLDGKPV